MRKKLEEYRNELTRTKQEYNRHIKRAGGGVIHEDAASEYRFLRRRILEGKIELLQEIIEEYENKLGSQ